MRKITYKGNTIQLGRHGKVVTGDTLMATEEEWQNWKHSDDFVEVEAIETPDKPVVLPKKTPDYDLRTVKWNSGRFSRLLRKFNKGKLIRILTAMKFVGVRIEMLPTHRDELDSIVDAIHHAAVISGWTGMTHEEILTCGVQEKPAKKLPQKQTPTNADSDSSKETLTTTKRSVRSKPRKRTRKPS